MIVYTSSEASVPVTLSVYTQRNYFEFLGKIGFVNGLMSSDDKSTSKGFLDLNNEEKDDLKDKFFQGRKNL